MTSLHMRNTKNELLGLHAGGGPVALNLKEIISFEYQNILLVLRAGEWPLK